MAAGDAEHRQRRRTSGACRRTRGSEHTHAHAFDAVAREHGRIGLPVSTENSHAFDARVLATEEAEYAAV